MVQALFIDFYGTVVHEYGKASYEVIHRIAKSVPEVDAKTILAHWWQVFNRLTAEAKGATFLRQYDIAYRTFQETLNAFNSPEDPLAMCDKMKEHWRAPPAYSDALDFVNNSPLPVYFVTNGDNDFVQQALDRLNLKPAGVMTSERARCYKPTADIFIKALEMANLSAKEVLHIGDSLRSDVQGALGVGITPIWLNREEKPVTQKVMQAQDFSELPDMLSHMRQHEPTD